MGNHRVIYMGRSVVVTVDYPSSKAFSDYSDLYPSAVSFSKLPQFRDDLATFHSDCSFPAKSRGGNKKKREKENGVSRRQRKMPRRERKARLSCLIWRKFGSNCDADDARWTGAAEGVIRAKGCAIGWPAIIGIFGHRSELWHGVRGSNWRAKD